MLGEKKYFPKYFFFEKKLKKKKLQRSTRGQPNRLRPLGPCEAPPRFFSFRLRLVPHCLAFDPETSFPPINIDP